MEETFPWKGSFYSKWKILKHLKKLCGKWLIFVPLALQNTFQWAWLQWEGKQVCSCILAHVVHFIPVLTSSLPPSLPLSLFPLSLKVICFTSLVHWRRAWRVLARLRAAQPCSSRQLSGEGLDAASSPSQPASPLSQLWHNLKRATTEDLWWKRWTALLYGNCSATAPSSLRGMYPELACRPHWQRHTEQPSSIKVTTWSDVTAALAARTKAASAPFGIRTRLDRGP